MDGNFGNLLSTLHRRSLIMTEDAGTSVSSLLHSLITAHLASLLQRGGLICDHPAHDSGALHSDYMDTSCAHADMQSASLYEELLIHALLTLAGSPVGIPSPQLVERYLGTCRSAEAQAAAATLLCRTRCRSDADVDATCSSLRRLGHLAEASSVEVARGVWWSNRGTGGTAKALYFFARAGPPAESRCQAIYEQGLLTCVHAVVSCGLFKQLSPEFAHLAAGRKGEAMSALGGHVEDLKDALVAASELLAVQRRMSQGDVCGWLALYKQGVEVMVEVSRGLQANKARAIESLASLLLDDAPVCAPVRYWPHLIDALMWLHNTTFVLEPGPRVSAGQSAGPSSCEHCSLSRVQLVGLLDALHKAQLVLQLSGLPSSSILGARIISTRQNLLQAFGCAVQMEGAKMSAVYASQNEYSAVPERAVSALDYLKVPPPILS